MSSNNDLAARVVGFRLKEAQPLDPPAELGFHCPVCTYQLVHEGKYDERLQWSELNGFLWCSFCKKDYPAPFCMRDIERAIKIYLMCVKEIVERKRPKRPWWRPYRRDLG